MDPRKAATVTAPDLLEAFKEGTGEVDSKAVATTENPNRIWLILMLDSEVIETTDFPFADLAVAMESASAHLRNGHGHTAILLVGDVQPQLFTDAVEALSAHPA